MEASVTTDTVIASEQPAPNHSHGPNFGRYVAGCDACARKFPDGPPPKVDRKAQRRAAQELKAQKRVERIEAKRAEVESKAREIVSAALPPQAPGVTMEQVLALLQHQPQMNQTGLSMEQLMQFATELRKPDPELVAEREAAKTRLLEVKRQNHIVVAAQIAATALRQANCSHKMPRGENAISGQQHSDGLVHPLCVICQKEFTPYKPAGDQMQMGLS